VPSCLGVANEHEIKGAWNFCFAGLVYVADWLFEFVFRRFHKIAKSDCQLRHVRPSVCPSVRPHGTTRLPLDGFS
jgi:hypothetical protein